MSDDPNSTEYGEWGAYELRCETCGTPIIAVALVDQWERGETETQQVIAEGATLQCQACQRVPTMSAN